jgi:hypothetical protein
VCAGFRRKAGRKKRPMNNPVKAQFEEASPPPLWRALIVPVGVAIAAALIVAAAVSGCTADWNKPHSPAPRDGLPCGYSYHQCPSGGCCGNGFDCRPGGYCAFVGYGAAPDGGDGLAPQLTPEQARKAAPR